MATFLDKSGLLLYTAPPEYFRIANVEERIFYTSSNIRIALFLHPYIFQDCYCR
jgi:hypothetical protein